MSCKNGKENTMSWLTDIFGGKESELVAMAKAAQSPEELMAHVFVKLSDSPEALDKAATLIADLNKAAKSPTVQQDPQIPFENQDVQMGDFKYQDFNDKLFLNQLYDSDMRPSGISNYTLSRMAFRSTLISAIIQKRVTQIQQFAIPQKSKYDLGYTIEPVSNEVPTLRQQEDIKRLTEAVENLGFTKYDPLRGDFYTFMRLITQDTLTFDAVTFEKVYDRHGVPIAFRATDASCMHPRWDKEEKKFVVDEYIEGARVHTYSTRDMVYAPRNVTTDRRWFGYGISELERLIHIVTSHLYAEEYNKRLFKSGHFLNGLISLKGQISRPQFQEFKRDFYSFVTGVENTNKVAIVNAPQGIDVINSIRSPQDMGFATFMDYMVKVAAAVYLMDPIEINFFVNGSTGQSSPTLTNSSQEQRLKYSKDSGLPPLLNHAANVINRTFLQEVAPEYKLSFKGLDEEDKMTRQKYLIGEKEYKTLNEVRAEENLPPLPAPLGDVIKDSGYIQLLRDKIARDAQMQQQQQVGEDGGDSPTSLDFDFGKIEAFLVSRGHTPDEIEAVREAMMDGSLSLDEFLEYTETTKEEVFGEADTETPVLTAEEKEAEIMTETAEENINKQGINETDQLS